MRKYEIDSIQHKEAVQVGTKTNSKIPVLIEKKLLHSVKSFMLSYWLH